MAAKNSSVFTENLSFEHVTSAELLVLFVSAVSKLNWKIGPISESGFIAYVQQLRHSGIGEVTVLIRSNSVFMASRSISLQLVDVSQIKANLDTLFITVMELKNTLSQDELSSKYIELKKGFVSQDRSFISQPPSTVKEDLESFTGIFKPRYGYCITPILINLNILVFVLMIISGIDIMVPTVSSLVQWGADDSQLTKSGEWWRLLTSSFLHIGIVHLFANMFALYYIGLLLEPYLGPGKFISGYLVTAIAASATSLWWHPVGVSAGASGANFGMYGVFLAMLTTKLIAHPSKSALLTSIAVFVAYSIMGGMKPGIDNAAHLGGLVSGMIIGYAYLPALKKKVGGNYQSGPDFK